MSKNMTPQQQLEAKEIGRKYYELKNLRAALTQEKMLEVEQELTEARNEFAEYLSHIYERENYPYKWSISQIAVAMGTPTGRQKVREFLGEAVERKKTKFFMDDVFTLPYTLHGVWSETSGNPAYTTTWAVVEEGGRYWDVTYQGASRYNVLAAVPDDNGDFQRIPSVPKHYKHPLDNDSPEWLRWLVEQDEWKNNL